MNDNSVFFFVDPTLPGNPDIISQCERPGYQSYFQSCFRVVTDAKTFSQAQAVCEAEMANLASLNDLYEEAFAEVVLFNNNLDSAWIGLQADPVSAKQLVFILLGAPHSIVSVAKGTIWSPH